MNLLKVYRLKFKTESVNSNQIEDRVIHRLKPKQATFIFSPEADVVFVGGVGTLKTSSLIKRGMVLSEESPKNLGVIVRKTFVDLRDSTVRDFELETGIQVSKDTKEAILNNGSVIMFRHGDELPGLKNLNLGWFGIEQAEEFPDSTAWDMLQMRLRRKVKVRSAFMIANANGHNWIYQRFIEPEIKPLNTRVIEASTLEFLDIHPPDYFERLKKLPEKRYNRYVLNSHEETEGLVYDEFRESNHVIEPFSIPETWERGFVLDHGYRNPTAVLWYAIDYDGNVILYDEHYEKERPVSYHAEKIKLRHLNDGYADPSIFSKTQQRNGFVYSIADEYRDFGIGLRPAMRSDEFAAIARVNEFFKAGRIKVFKTLSNFREEIGLWSWKSVKPGYSNNLPEEPEDKDNHLMDDLKYLVQSRFPSATKLEPIPEYHSLDWFDKQKNYEHNIKEARSGTKVW